MSKYYAILVGRTSGIYTSWEEARKQVEGFSGAKFKSFSSLQDATTYLSSSSPSLSSSLSSSLPSSLFSPLPSSLSSSISYCDGSCVNKIGGYGIVILLPTGVRQYKGRVPYNPCTNNKAELYAILQVLELAPETTIIRTDSQYAIKSVTEWVHSWKRNGWRTTKGTPVENRELIERIVNKISHPIQFEHVYGHRGDTYNELTDRLANEGRLI